MKPAAPRWPIVLVLISLSFPAHAQGPVAIVEDIEGKVAGIEFMDYLSAGKTLTLGSGDKVVIGYLKSCWRETIAGSGIVTIGTEQSTVANGQVSRTKVRCENDSKGVVSKETVGSGAMVFRKKPENKQRQQTVFSLSPVIEVGKANDLIIQRIDQPGEPIKVSLAKGSAAARGGFFDLAKNNIALLAGATYKAKVEQREVIFQVDRQSERNAAGIVGRLVQMSPPN